MAVVLLLALACGNSSAAKDGAPPDVRAVMGDAMDAHAASDVISPGADGPADSAAASDAQEAGGGCKTNADCPAGHACYFQIGTACGGSGGVCVNRLNATCPQTRGGGCACLDVPKIECSGDFGGACQGGDVPTGCCWCYVPV